MKDLICPSRGCGTDTQTELIRTSPGGLQLGHCNGCGRDFVQSPAPVTCPTCLGIGSHADGCDNERMHAV